MTVCLLPSIAASYCQLTAVAEPTVVVAGAGALALILLVSWFIFGRGPKRARHLARSARLLRQGQWQAALALVQALKRGGRLNATWQTRLRSAEGECHRIAGIQAVQAKEFEQSLEHHLRAAEILGINAAEVRASVLDKLLAEVRALFAATTGPDTAAVHAMLVRLQKLSDPQPSPEALFWQGLCHIRECKWEPATEALNAARTAAADISRSPDTVETAGARDPGFVDPPLYLGGILLRLGQAKEGLRYIAEANREGGNCPWISLQLGIAMVAAGADSHLATRALNRALGPRGLTTWLKEPEKAWIEGLPAHRSFVGKLAAQHRFVCPLWGSDIRLLIRRGRLALGQAQYRLGDYHAAAQVFKQLLDESAPTHDVLRWLGLTQARLAKYQEAFYHLKTALELEDPKDRLTAGYLALCAARAKPDRPEDKGPNVAWAIRTVREFTGLGDIEWVTLLVQVFGEARKPGPASQRPATNLSADDQLFLCDHLLSVKAVDLEAAAAYHQLAAEYPELVKPPQAWLYCRAAMIHTLDNAHALDLFAKTFQTVADAHTYFSSQGWDFSELEYFFLRSAALQSPGAFPTALGSDYPPRGEAMLLQRSARLEKEGQTDAALASADMLLRLAPTSPRAHDRLAELWYRLGNLDLAAELLQKWCALEPNNAVPWARLAVVHHQQGQRKQCAEAMNEALQRANGPARADVACLAARLEFDNSPPGRDSLERSLTHLQHCLQVQPNHEQALWLSAAVNVALNNRESLAACSGNMDGKDAQDPRFHYFAAISHLAAGKYDLALAAAKAAAFEPALKVEASYVAGWANLHRNDLAAAATEFQIVAQAPESPSCSHARAMLGAIQFRQGEIAEAVHWWQALDPPRRSAWQVAEPLQRSKFLAGLHALQDRNFEQAADRFREAGKAGLREKALGEMIRYSLVKAGQRLLYAAADATGIAPLSSSRIESAARLLEQALNVGQVDPNVAYMLAMARKRLGKIGDARAALQMVAQVAQADAQVVLQRGLLAFKDSQFVLAEEEFAKALQLDPAFFAAGYDLMLALLCQGKVEACLPIVKQLRGMTAPGEDQRFLGLLEPLLACCQGGKSASAPPDRAPNNDAMASALTTMSPAEEQRLLDMLFGLGQMEAVFPLLQGLVQTRPHSQTAQRAFAAGVLLQAKVLADRCQWQAAKELLTPLAAGFSDGEGVKVLDVPRVPSKSQLPAKRREGLHLQPDFQVATYNLLGCCQCMLQEFERGIDCFSWAIKLSSDDPWLHQNLALAWELRGQLDQADSHWNRYFELQARVPAPLTTNYRDNLAYEGLNRLSEAFAKKERWNAALTYLQRACRLRPGDFDALERLFHMYNQVKRPEDARRALVRLRELRPGDPQLELYELDLREVKTLEDIERMLADIRKVLNRYPNDMRVEEKGVLLVGNVIPLVGRMCDQYTDQLNRVVEQVRRLPNYQISWSAVHDVMRDLQREFQKLRRIANKCFSLVNSQEHRRMIRELIEHIDKKTEVCQQMGA